MLSKWIATVTSLWISVVRFVMTTKRSVSHSLAVEQCTSPAIMDFTGEDTCDERDLHRMNQVFRPCRVGSSSVVLDMQCFKDNNNEFILKEVTVIDVTSGTILLHHVAKSPYDRDGLSTEKQRECYWLTKHYHGLQWDQGDITYNVLMDKLRTCLAKRSIVYVKGQLKRDFVLKNLITASDPSTVAATVLDMSDIGCTSLSTISNLLSTNAVRCGQHKSTGHRCSLANSTLLRSWLLMTGSESRCGNYFCCCK